MSISALAKRKSQLAKTRGKRRQQKSVEQVRKERRERDPFTYYNDEPQERWTDPKTGETFRLGPGPTQLACLQDGKTAFRLLEGGNQTGKTAHCVAECAMYARGIHPSRPWFGPVSILVLITSRQQALRIWHRKMIDKSMLRGPAYNEPMIPSHEIEKIFYDHAGTGKVPRCIRLKNGSEIEFNWSGTVQTWERIQGGEYDACFIDEASGTSKLIAEVKARFLTRIGDRSRPGSGFILWSATPTMGNDSHRAYRRSCINSEPNFKYFRINSDENPAVRKEARDMLSKSMSQHDAKVRMWGTSTDDEQYLVYADHWKDETHLADPDYVPQLTDNLWVGFDPAFGRTGSDVGLVFAAINRDEPSTVRVVRCIQYRNGTLHEYVQYIQDWLQGRFLEGIVCDPAIRRTESTGLSVYSQFIDELSAARLTIERGVICGRNRYEDTIPVVRRYLDLQHVQINAHEDGCQELRYQLQSTRTRDPTKYSGPRGVVRKHQDLADALRYLLTVEPAWCDRGPNPLHGKVVPPQQRVLDPTDPAITEDMPEDVRRHKLRIQASIKLIDGLNKGRKGDRWDLETVRW